MNGNRPKAEGGMPPLLGGTTQSDQGKGKGEGKFKDGVTSKDGITRAGG
jgi:hypothetical protein